jgi:protein-tyrosine phosphatase
MRWVRLRPLELSRSACVTRRPWCHHEAVRARSQGSGPLFLDIDGLVNIRDLGGYPVGEHARTRTGLVYRSDSIHRVTAAGAPSLAALGVRTVIDLRSAAERSENPGPLPIVPIEVQENPVASGGRFDARAISGRRAGEEILRDLYLDMFERSARQFGRILLLLADGARLAAVIHCAGGKDRTGATVALLLSALGVDREDVLDDYAATPATARAATAAYRSRLAEVLELFVSSGIEEEAALGMLSTPRWAMEEALTWVDDSRGGVVAYLLGPAGLSTQTLGRLERLLVDVEPEE